MSLDLEDDGLQQVPVIRSNELDSRTLLRVVESWSVKRDKTVGVERVIPTGRRPSWQYRTASTPLRARSRAVATSASTATQTSWPGGRDRGSGLTPPATAKCPA
jgi:hypothetical protein